MGFAQQVGVGVGAHGQADGALVRFEPAGLRGGQVAVSRRPDMVTDIALRAGFNPLQRSHHVGDINMRAAAADDLGKDGVFAQDEDALGIFEGQGSVIFEQDDAFGAGAAQNRTMSRVVAVLFGLQFGVFKGPGAFDGAQHAADFVVEFFFGQAAQFEGFFDMFGLGPAGRAGHFEVEAAFRSGGAVSAEPVGHDDAVEAPAFFQNFV